MFKRLNGVAVRCKFCMRNTWEKRSSETVLQYGGRRTGKTALERFNAVAERSKFCIRKTWEKRSLETVLQYGGRRMGKTALERLNEASVCGKFTECKLFWGAGTESGGQFLQGLTEAAAYRSPQFFLKHKTKRQADCPLPHTPFSQVCQRQT